MGPTNAYDPSWLRSPTIFTNAEKVIQKTPEIALSLNSIKHRLFSRTFWGAEHRVDILFSVYVFLPLSDLKIVLSSWEFMITHVTHDVTHYNVLKRKIPFHDVFQYFVINVFVNIEKQFFLSLYGTKTI